MVYSIKICYDEGSSDHTDKNLETELKMTWSTLEGAVAALKRIEEHYRWYYGKHNGSWQHDHKNPAPSEPEWHKGIKYEHVLKLVLDNGNEVEFGAFWCGYFEHLNWAEVTQKLPRFDI